MTVQTSVVAPSGSDVKTPERERIDKPRPEKPVRPARSDREARHKLERLVDYLDRYQLDGVLLQRPSNFAWVTCGRDNHVAYHTQIPAAAILATADGQRLCLATSTEAARMHHEELAKSGVPVITFPWWDRKASAARLNEVLAGRKIAADLDALGLGLPPVPEDFRTLRWVMTPEEVARYREGAARVTAAMEQACREIAFGASEQEIAGMVDYHIRARGCVPTTTMVAADERVAIFQQPRPTGQKVEHYVMLTAFAEYKGLVSSLTRFVTFGPPPSETAVFCQAVANASTSVILSTRPGRSLGDTFRSLQTAYADNGYPDEWQAHPQGGSTGYAEREVVAFPGCPVIIRENQAFAWNPSVRGIRSEETILCTTDGVEVLTAASEDWPTLQGISSAGELKRPDMLVR